MGAMNNKCLMAKVCELYYTQNKSQKEISAILSVPRPQICRLTTAVKEMGTVNIPISSPYVREMELEDRLTKYFGIRDALVVDSTCGEGENRMQSFAKEAFGLVEDHVPQDARVGVMSEYTCKAMIDAMGQSPKKLKPVAPLADGISTINMSAHADTLAQKLADLHGISALNLNASAAISDLNLAVPLREEEPIAKVLGAGKKADIVLVGIGSPSKGVTNIQLSNLRKQDVDELRRQGAVASVCSSYLDKDGCEVGQEILEHSIGQSLKDLKKSRIITAAIGDSKVEAIKAALRSGRIDTLVTDPETAKQI